MPAPQNILALDVATKTGFAWSDGERIEHGLWDLSASGSEHDGRRLMRFEDRLYEAIERWPIELIAFEELMMGSKGMIAAMQRSQLRGVLMLVAAKNEIAVRPCHISSVKVFATDKGNASKPEMIHAARVKLGVDVTNDNIADALWVLKYAQADVAEAEKRVKSRRAVKEKQDTLF